MHIRRRTYEHGKIKRITRKVKNTETFYSTFGTYFKLLAVWGILIMIDFFTDFRFEFILSCWLMVRTVSDSFRYQGLAFALFFTIITITVDLLCYFLVPTTLIYLLGSSCVWMQLVWQADRGIYIPTVALCFLFFYVEVAFRLRDPKYLPLSIDLCRPFAAHCIGYPVVTIGFGLKSMISHHIRMRRQRSVESQNKTFFALLEEALPKDFRNYLKAENIPKSKCLTSNDDTCSNMNCISASNSCCSPSLSMTITSTAGKDKLSKLANFTTTRTAATTKNSNNHNLKPSANHVVIDDNDDGDDRYRNRTDILDCNSPSIFDMNSTNNILFKSDTNSNDFAYHLDSEQQSEMHFNNSQDLITCESVLLEKQLERDTDFITSSDLLLGLNKGSNTNVDLGIINPICSVPNSLDSVLHSDSNLSCENHYKNNKFTTTTTTTTNNNNNNNNTTNTVNNTTVSTTSTANNNNSNKRSPSSLLSATSSSSGSNCSVFSPSKLNYVTQTNKSKNSNIKNSELTKHQQSSSSSSSSSSAGNPSSNTHKTGTSITNVTSTTASISAGGNNNNTGNSSGVGGSNSGSGGGGGRSNPPNSHTIPSACKSGAKNSSKDEYTLKLEAEAKRLKSEIQCLRSSEIQLRSQVQQLLAAERTYRSESSQAQQESETLQAKLNQLTQRSETDRASLQAAEKRLTEERKQRQILEQQLRQKISKRNEEIKTENLPNEPVNCKVIKSSSRISRSTSPLNLNNSEDLNTCSDNDLCASRIRELESELHNLTRSLSVNCEKYGTNLLNNSNNNNSDNNSNVKNTTTTTTTTNNNNNNLSKSHLKSLRNEHSKHTNTSTQSVEHPCCPQRDVNDNSLNDLNSRVNSLIEENQRLTDTLKEEDKMKQELMTAYHSSLKEITELNEALTKKEYQLVELNMQLNYLTPQLCEYVSMLNGSGSSNPNKSSNNSNQVQMNCVTDEQFSTINPSAMLYPYYSKPQTNERDCLATNVSSISSNGMNTYNSPASSIYSNPKTSTPNTDGFTKNKSSRNPGFLFGERNIPGFTQSTSNSNPMSNIDCFMSRSVYTSDRPGYPLVLDGRPQINNQVFSRHNRVPNSHSQFNSGLNSGVCFDYTGSKSCGSYHNQFGNYVSSTLPSVLSTNSPSSCSTRPLPVGSSAPTTSPPPSLLPPPGLIQNEFTSNVLQMSNPSSSLPSLEIVVNSSVCVTETMTSPKAIGSYSPQAMSDSYLTESVPSVSLNINHRDVIRPGSDSVLVESVDRGQNNSVVDSLILTNSECGQSTVYSSVGTNQAHFGLQRYSRDMKSNCFDYNSFGPIGQVPNLINSNPNSFGTSSVLSKFNKSSDFSKESILSDKQHNTDNLKYPAKIGSNSSVDGNSTTAMIK